MNTKTEFIERLDDLIFENRNKDYGAYAIRRTYSDNVNKAFFVALSVATLLALLPFINSMFGSKPSVAIDTPTNCPTELLDLKRILIEALPKQMTQTPHRVSESTVVPTRVTTDEVVQHENISLTATSTIIEEGDEGENPFPNEGETSKGTGVNTEGTGSSGAVLVPGMMAEYTGGMDEMARFLTRALRYPGKARRDGVEGTVYVSFIVDTFGKVIRAEILKGISKECDQEAKRVVSLMPGWKAAKQNGIPVMVKMVLPIKFSLGNKD